MRTVYSMCLSLLLGLGVAAADQPIQHVRLAVGQQLTVTPGFAIGDTNGANTSVADFLVSQQRRQVTVMALKPGTASIALWDQRGTLRLNVSVEVVRQLDEVTTNELNTFLRRYPTVGLLNLRGQPVLSGEVEKETDLQAIEKVAVAAGIECAVILRTPPPPLPRTFTVEYELRLLESDPHFTTQAYTEGVEPSGRELYRARVVATSGATAQTFVGGRLADPKNKTAAAGGVDTGLRVSFTPRHAGRVEADTEILVETNLPISTLYVPSEWRRFRQTFPTKTSAPIAIAGNELLAAPDPPRKGSRLGSVARWVARIAPLPGVSGVKGATEVPVFSSLVASASYREGRSQLLLLIVPRVSGLATE